MRAGGSFCRFWYEKLRLQQAFSLPCEVIADVSYTYRVPTSGEDGVGSTPPSKAAPPYHTHLYGVKCTQRVDSQTPHGLPHIHQKMGSTMESRRRVRAARKPSDVPLRKGETQSPTAPVEEDRPDWALATRKKGQTATRCRPDPDIRAEHS